MDLAPPEVSPDISSDSSSAAPNTAPDTAPSKARSTALDVSIVIPVYNEIGALEETVQEVSRYMNDSGLTYEVILVDDGSTDGTGELMARISMPNVRTIKHEVNQGYGAALKTGLKNAKYDLMAITDADGTYPNERLPELVKSLGDNDMLVGARTGQNVQIPAIRKPAKKALNELANYLSDTKIPDLNSGLRVMRKATVKKFMHILPDSFSFTTTITLAMLSDGYNVKYVPIDYYHRAGDSKINPIKDTVRFTQLVVRTVMYFNPLRVFVPISLTLFLASFLVLVYRLISGEGLLVLGIILFVSAIQVLTTGMLADLIDKTNARHRETK